MVKNVLNVLNVQRWNINLGTFITYLYKERLFFRFRFYYSLVFDLSPTLRQIASISLFFVTRNAKQFSVYLVPKWHQIHPSTYNNDLRHYSIFGKHISIIITLVIRYAVIMTALWCNGYDARLMSKGFRVRDSLENSPFGFGQIWLTECYNFLQYIMSCCIPILRNSRAAPIIFSYFSSKHTIFFRLCSIILPNSVNTITYRLF